MVRHFREARTWKRLWPTDNSLRLSMEEAMYLNAEIGILHVYTGNCQECEPNILWKKFYGRYGIRFVKRYVTYRHFRLQGWVVRSGLHCGVDFMLYRDGPEYYHSSAAVRIISAGGERSVASFIALNRELNSMKKTLVEVLVLIPEDCEIPSISCIHSISIIHTTALTWKTSDDR
uniref:tRNA-intron lyase n=1 Tax=Setaria digitata TaxID=48799 RepID=A0A915PMF6_9BILA